MREWECSGHTNFLVPLSHARGPASGAGWRAGERAGECAVGRAGGRAGGEVLGDTKKPLYLRKRITNGALHHRYPTRSCGREASSRWCSASSSVRCLSPFVPKSSSNVGSSARLKFCSVGRVAHRSDQSLCLAFCFVAFRLHIAFGNFSLMHLALFHSGIGSQMVWDIALYRV